MKGEPISSAEDAQLGDQFSGHRNPLKAFDQEPWDRNFGGGLDAKHVFFGRFLTRYKITITSPYGPYDMGVEPF